MRIKVRKLTENQKFFVAEYQKDRNATRAALAAGYSRNRPDRAGEIGYQLLQKTPIKEALERAMAEKLRKIGVHTERILTEIARVAFSDIRKLYREDGTLKPPNEWDDDTAAAVAGLEVFEEFEGRGKSKRPTGLTKKIRTYDKPKALDMLARHDGIIGNEKHHEDDEEKVGRVPTTLEVSAKIVYLVKLAAERRKQLEGAKPEKEPGG